MKTTSNFNLTLKIIQTICILFITYKFYVGVDINITKLNFDNSKSDISIENVSYDDISFEDNVDFGWD
jgi:hypothetical protein